MSAPGSIRCEASQVARPVAVRTTDSSEHDDRPLSIAGLWERSSSWLVSAVFHVVLLMVLALTWITLTQQEKSRFLMAHLEGQDLEDLEDSTLEDQLDDIELEQADALPINVQDPGMAAFGEPAGIETQAAVDIGTVNLSKTMGDIGALFGKDGKGWSTAGDGMGGAEFYGLKAGGRKFVFVVDNSLSMKDGRFEAACYELYKSVSKMTPYQSFYVFFFSDTAYPLFHPRPASGMVKASPENKQALKNWLRTVELVLKTNARGAMQKALALKPDGIYILTDGAFTDDTYRYLMGLTPKQTAVRSIHTVGMELAKPGTEKVLRDISKQHNGTFRLVRVDPRIKQMVGKGSRPRHTHKGPVWGIALGQQKPKAGGKRPGGAARPGARGPAKKKKNR